MAAGNYRSLATLKIDNQDAPESLMGDLLQIVVEESLHLPGMFTLIVRNDYKPGQAQDKPWRYKDLLQIGKPVKIGFVSSTTQAKEFSQEQKGEVLEGEITAIEAQFGETTQAPIIVRGYDLSHRLHRGQFNRSFQNMTDSDIVKKIAKEVRIDIGEDTIDDSGAPHDYVFQKNQTNMAFLRGRAARIGFELFVQDGILYFRKPKADKEVLKLKWLTDIHSFHVRMSSAEQVKEVEVRAWDYSQKRSIVSTAKSEQVITDTENGKGSNTSNKFNGQPAKPKLIVVDQPVFQPKEADAMAQALCNELGGQFIQADAKGEGNPKIRPGRVVELKELGSYDGKYYITETRHSYHERVYMTEFSVRGLRGGDLLTLLAPPTQLQPGQTLMVGVVTDNEDPQGWGRVKVKLPTLTEDHASNWARVVAIGAGHQRGFDCLPEIDDEVLVGFEHGDIHRPYILGGVWNGKDEPPNSVDQSVQDGKVRLRTIKTRSGHQVQFVEEDSGGRKKGIYIETNGGQKIALTDSDGSISISSIAQLETTAGVAATINAPAITITGVATVTITAPAIALNGAVLVNGKPLPA